MTDEQRGSGSGPSLREVAGRKVEGIARKVGLTPVDRGWVTLDVGATLFSLSPKLVVDFFKAVREVDPQLGNGDLRAWAELGRRIAQHSPDEAAEFFHDSASILKSLSPPLRTQLIALASRQIVLSPAAALALIRLVESAPHLIDALKAQRAKRIVPARDHAALVRRGLVFAGMGQGAQLTSLTSLGAQVLRLHAEITEATTEDKQ